MKKISKIIVTIMLMLLISSCARQTVNTNEIITKRIDYVENITINDLEDALVLACEKAEASVVGVEASGVLTNGFGSGVIINYEKEIDTYKYTVLTNYHVLSYKNTLLNNVKIYLGKYKETCSAKVLDYNKELDVAFVSFESSRLLTTTKVGDSTNFKKGRFAIAVGSPYDLVTYYDSVSIGNVSSPNRLVEDENGNNNYYIQHTAAINSGNSGGGLFDIHGNLMGINTWKYAETDIEGMGFAIPIHIITQKYSKYF